MKRMRKPLIYTALKKYAESNPVRLHMPGHKGRSAGSTFAEDLYSLAPYDITELSFSGCLETDEGIIFQAEKNVAEILGAKHCHFVTDGSSAAILSMIFAMKGKGSKIILQRNSHKSVFNAIYLFGLEPLFLPSVSKDGIPYADTDALEKILTEETDVCGAVLISPDYYGIVPDLKKAAFIAHKHGILLGIDGAHGGHLKFSAPEFYAGNYADVWVDGVHKTLPCYTQCSLLCTNDEDLNREILKGLSFFRTTSPSYPLMASIEFGEYYAEHYGKSKYPKLLENIRFFKENANILGVEFAEVTDKTKIIIDCDSSLICAEKLADFLEKNGVFIEMNDGRYLCLMASIMTEKKDLTKVLRVLKEYTQLQKVQYIAQKQHNSNSLPLRAMTYNRALKAEAEYVPIEKASGRIAAVNAGVFPPCYPIVLAGEIIDGGAIHILKNDKNVFGTENGYIKVVKEKNER